MSNKNKNKTVWGVIGVLLILFGILGTIPVILNREYIAGLIITILAVVIGVILIAWTISD